ncbi:MAG: single-stranded-DNA-specific exonuclease RecJ [Clostridia bacterium]|nr:single-stranded-DNA-specific exonuclease RecJ [Clostridia bacterium]
MKKIAPEYTFSEEQLNTVKQLAKQCGLLEDTVKILYGRGVDTAEKIEKFIHPSRANFISPFKMSGMDKAVELITRARDEEWAVVVYGDYDADGVCASTIMSSALKDFGIQPYVYIPERREGYGLNKKAIDDIFEECFPQLFITVDCGISCAEEVEYIKEQGAEVIVTDHHELPDKIPDCICVNPKFSDDYIYDNLCGAGVALKVGIALNGEDAYKYLDFAAIATVADSVPLTGENRDIVFEGLKLINNNPRKCYSHFLSKSDSVTSQTIAFGIAPKINAAGRMGSARSALQLFTESDENVIFDLASSLMAFNIERQKYCDELYNSAKSKLKERGAYGKVIMLWDESWNTGFVGIVAARLADEFNRPVLLFVRNGDVLKGSARSVENVNIFEALKACEKYIQEFGGHSQAAGVNINTYDFENLENALNEYLSAHYSPEDFEPTLYISGALTAPYSLRFAKELEMLEPFGVGNRRPMFEVEEGALEVKPVKPLSPHINLKSGKIELLYFSGAKHTLLMESSAPKRYVFEYNISTYRGKQSVKGYVRDIVYSRTAGKYCEEEIAVNNIFTLSGSQTEAEEIYLPHTEIDDLVSECTGYGTIFIAEQYQTLSHYKNLEKLPVELFRLSSGNVADAVLLSPKTDVDLSGYKRIIYLDRPAGGVRLPSLTGKNVIICEDIDGNNYLKGLPCERQQLLNIFSAVLANCANMSGNDGCEICFDNKITSPRNLAFALEVFRQLSLISYEDGKVNVFRGVKSELTNSQLYNIVCKVNL